MKKVLNLVVVLAVALGVPATGQNKKLGQTGMKFLSVATDPRAAAMGEAFTAIEGSSTALFFNPAGLARLPVTFQGTFGVTRWIADINHTFASAAIGTPNNEYGVFGVTFQSVDYGEMIRTIRVNNSNQGWMDVGTFSPAAVSIGLGYAKSLSDKFAIGGRVSYNLEDLGQGIASTDELNNPIANENRAEVVSFDIGMYYRTGIKSLDFAVSVRNFSKEARFVREGFQLPLTFRIGLSMNASDILFANSDADPLLVAVDAVNARDFPETINLGGEYLFMKTFAVRAGYMFGYDERGFTAGVGLVNAIAGLGVDYAYTPFGVFGNVNRIAIQFAY